MVSSGRQLATELASFAHTKSTLTLTTIVARATKVNACKAVQEWSSNLPLPFIRLVQLNACNWILPARHSSWMDLILCAKVQAVNLIQSNWLTDWLTWLSLWVAQLSHRVAVSQRRHRWLISTAWQTTNSCSMIADRATTKVGFKFRAGWVQFGDTFRATQSSNLCERPKQCSSQDESSQWATSQDRAQCKVAAVKSHLKQPPRQVIGLPIELCVSLDSASIYGFNLKRPQINFWHTHKSAATAEAEAANLPNDSTWLKSKW